MAKKGVKKSGESPFKITPKEEVQFLDSFEKNEDPRSTKNQLYSVSEILLVTLCAVLCGADGWCDVEMYGKSKINYLRQYLDYNNGVPSDDTIRRFYRKINPSAFEQLFREWVNGLAKKAEAQVIAIDGKSSRYSFDGEGNILHMISAFATEAKYCWDKKKYQIKAMKLLPSPKCLIGLM